MKRGILAAITILTLVSSAASAASGGSGSKVDSSLQATGTDSDASGRAKFRVRGTSDGRFEIKGQRLDRDAAYEIVVNGVRVGDLLTNGGGSGKLRFRSHPRSSSDVLLGFDPRGASVVVRDANGSDVLAANIPLVGTLPDGDVICCIPDDSGAECEDRTPDECLAQGGTLSAATSCLPDPCGSTPPGDDDVICCIPDDLGAECEDRTPAECSTQGGVVVEATSCTPNPCSGIAPSDDDIRCCLSDNSGTECEDRTPGECVAQGGISLGAGACTLDACDGVMPPGGGGSTPVVVVTCEKRSSRSRASVNGKNLAAGSYTARLISGANEATAVAAGTIGDEVEFDFDSNTEVGATSIAATFLQGAPPQATGQIIDAGGGVVAAATVTCVEK